jgi:dynein heavy chain 1
VNTPTNPFCAPLPVPENKTFNQPAREATSAPILAEPTQWGNEKDALLQIDEKPAPGPQVTTFFAKSDEDLGAALQLISDSVKEQRQMAIKSIVWHPYVIALSILVFLTSSKMLYTGAPRDLVFMLCSWVGYSLTGLFTVKRMVKGYDYLADRVGGWSWLSESSVSGVSHRRDEVLVAKFGDEIVGALVLRMARITGAGTPGFSYGIRSRRKSSARWTGIIRAWTVRESDRMQGIGRHLLEEAVSNCRLRSLDGPIFAEDHANATKVLPRLFNAVFDKHEKWANNILQETIIEQRGH